MSSGLIYLRNRYYDPGVGRFISEDPIRYGMNWYVYANNNPLKFIDPSGLYYTKPNKNGTYDLIRDTRISAAVKNSIVTFVPTGDLITQFVQQQLLKLDGNSVVKSDGSGIATNSWEEWAVAVGGKAAGKALYWFGVISNLPDAIEGMDISFYDDIAFGLLSKASLSTTNLNKDYAIGIMDKTYTYIKSFSSYFLDGMGSVFDNKSMHRIDYELSQSKNPEKMIENYKKKIMSSLVGQGHETAAIKMMGNQAADYLSKYSERRQEFFDLYTEYIYQ